MALRPPLSANDWHTYPVNRQQPGQCSVSAVVQALAAPPPLQFLVPKGATTGSTTTAGSAVEPRGRSVLVSGPPRPSTDSKHASPAPQRSSLSARLTQQDLPSSRASRLTGLASSDQTCRVIPPVGVSLSPEPCRRGQIGGISPQLLGRANSRSLDAVVIRDYPKAPQRTSGSCHVQSQRPRSNDVDNRSSLDIYSRFQALSENLEKFKSSIEGEVRAVAQANISDVADRIRMEERLQAFWQTGVNEEADARTAAVCRLDSEMTMLSANVNELREDLQRLMDLLYGELRSLVQSVQGSVDSAPQSRQGLFNGAAGADASGSPALATLMEDPPTARNLIRMLDLGGSADIAEEHGASHNKALVPREEVSKSFSRSSSTEHRLQHAADILARAGESAAALHEEQVAGMHNECRYVLEKLLDETVQGCVKYSIVKVAIFQALDALGTKETEALWRDTCWTLQKIEEWLTAKDRMGPGKDALSAKKVLDTTRAADAVHNILIGSTGVAGAQGSHDGSFLAASTTASAGACSHG